MTDDLPSESPTVSYLKGYNAGVHGIMASDNPTIAAWGAMDADSDRRREAESRASSEGGSGADGGAGVAYLLFLVLLSPPFFAPGYAVYLTWLQLTAIGWHPLFKLLAEGAEIFAICAVVWVLYRFIPRMLGAVLSALYIGACYAWALRWWGANDHWVMGVGIVTAAIGFFLGRYMHKSIATSGMTFGSAGLGTLGLYAAISTAASLFFYWAFCLVGGGWAVFKFFQLLDARGVNGYAAFAASVGLAIAILAVPPIVGAKLVRHAPKPVALILIMGPMAIAGAYAAHLANFDTVWTVAATVTAAVGGWGLTRLLAE